MYGTARHIQKLVAPVFTSHRTVPEQLSTGRRVIEGVSKMLDTITNCPEHLHNEMFSYRIEMRVQFGPSVMQPSAEDISRVVGPFMSLQGINQLLQDHCHVVARVRAHLRPISVDLIAKQTRYLLYEFDHRHAALGASGDRTPMKTTDQAILMLAANSIGFASPLWVDKMTEAFHGIRFTAVRHRLWAHLASTSDAHPALDSSDEDAAPRQLGSRHASKIVITARCPAVVPAEVSTVDMERLCQDHSGQLLQLAQRVVWSRTQSRGTSALAPAGSKPLWELRNRAGNIVASGTFSWQECIARLLATLPDPSSANFTDVTRLAYAAGARVVDAADAPVGQFKPDEMLTLDADTVKEAEAIVATVAWHSRLLTVGSVGYTTRAVHVLCWYALPRTGMPNRNFVTKNTLTKFEYAVRLLLKCRQKGWDWQSLVIRR